MEANAKTTVAQAVRKSLVDPKQRNEPITFGQALVTYHYMHSEPAVTSDKKH